jgi:hypothetical protein
MRMRSFVGFLALLATTIACPGNSGPAGNGGAPSANAGTDQNVIVGSTVNLSGSATDPDGDTIIFVWTFVSRPAGSNAALSNASATTPSFVADAAGTYDVRLTASDGNGGSHTDDVRIIASPNSAPAANAGPDQNVAVAATVNLSGSGSDPNGDPLIFSWAFVARPAGSNATLTNPTSANASFVADVAGTYDVRLTVSDNRGGSSTDDVRIIATPGGGGNQAPVANAGPDQAAVTSAVVILNGTGSSDPDGDPITLFAWTFVSRPAGSNATITNATSANASFVADVSGTFVVQLVVGDGQLLSAPDTATITVSQQNRAPTLSVTAPDAVFVGTQVQILATVNDPDGDVVTVDFELIQKPAGAGDLTEAGATATFQGDVLGLYVIRVTASDGRGGTAQTDVNVAVNANVAGSYTVTVTANAASCPGGSNETVVGTLPVLQPTPGTVILNLPGASSSFLDQAVGSLVGEDFSFSGPIRIQTSSGTFTFNGTIGGTITAAGQMNLGFTFNAPANVCTIPGTIVGTKN